MWLNNNNTDIRIARYMSAVTFKCAKKHWSLNISVCGNMGFENMVTYVVDLVVVTVVIVSDTF